MTLSELIATALLVALFYLVGHEAGATLGVGFALWDHSWRQVARQRVFHVKH